VLHPSTVSVDGSQSRNLAAPPRAYQDSART
jgi:hypothetical protein